MGQYHAPGTASRRRRAWSSPGTTVTGTPIVSFFSEEIAGSIVGIRRVVALQKKEREVISLPVPWLSATSTGTVATRCWFYVVLLQYEPIWGLRELGARRGYSM